eukprot:489911-Amorphochlora_amoeboformis.AAC.1
MSWKSFRTAVGLILSQGFGRGRLVFEKDREERKKRGKREKGGLDRRKTERRKMTERFSRKVKSN